MVFARQSIRRLLISGGAAALLAFPGVALAAPTGVSATSPALLTAPLSGSLPANSGGSYSYSQFNYPGNGSTVTLNLTVNNPLPLENGAAGFNVYQAGNLIGSSSETAPNAATFSMSSSTAGPVLVQVFDYDGSNGINFTLTPQGLPASSTAVTSSSATTSAATTAATSSSSAMTSAASPSNLPLGGSASGSLAGNSGGGFKLYTMPYAGNNQAVSLSMTVSPSTEIGTGLVGFNVYDANGILVGSAQQTDPNTLGLVVSNANGGAYTVQVFNYDPNTSIDYTIAQAAS